jgi:hypothetical protein
VTIYRDPGDVFLNRYLSRELMSPYWVRGTSEDVARLLGAPEGTEIKGTFVVYTGGPPWLLIAQLDLPSREDFMATKIRSALLLLAAP